LEEGRRVVLVGHSQGNLYVNQAWEALIASEQENVRTIAVATPADHVGDVTEPYTTLHRDSLAASLFAALGALPTNTDMDEECGGTLLGFDVPWLCHGFKVAYLKGATPREQILNHVVAALPSEPAEAVIEGSTYTTEYGTPFMLGGVTVTLFRPNFSVAAETVSDENGFYTLTVSEECVDCSLMGQKGFYISPIENPIDVLLGNTYEVDIALELLAPN
jgi:hypothetical protein